MIEPTAELRRAAYDALPPEVRIAPAELDEVLAAVLAIVKRDNWVVPHVAWPPACPPKRGANHPHYCVSCSDGEAAGPGCGNCRSTGMDQTPWPSCAGCGSPAGETREGLTRD